MAVCTKHRAQQRQCIDMISALYGGSAALQCNSLSHCRSVHVVSCCYAVSDTCCGETHRCKICSVPCITHKTKTALDSLSYGRKHGGAPLPPPLLSYEGVKYGHTTCSLLTQLIHGLCKMISPAAASCPLARLLTVSFHHKEAARSSVPPQRGR
jgi:hypothetical protein